MDVFIHKVLCGGEDGWGRSLSTKESILGIFSSEEKAIEHKKKRDSNPHHTYFDIGNSWIEKSSVK